MRYELGVIGAGNMAEAIVRAVLAAKIHAPSQIIAADPTPERRETFSRELGVDVTESNADAASADVVLLATKPQVLPDALTSVSAGRDERSLVISIAAGVSTAFIESRLENARVVRVMPNTPMLVGEGVSAMCGGADATSDDLTIARRLFSAGGQLIELEERHFDAVTAISGSGPAYVFYLIEQMIAAGERLGLSPEDATTLATRTAIGAGTMLRETGVDAAELRRRVTSPGGTTQAALDVFHERDLATIVSDAIIAAAERSSELGR